MLPIEHSAFSDCVVYLTTAGVSSRQKNPEIPSTREIGKVIYGPLWRKYGKEVATAICMANEDCQHLLREYAVMVEERIKLIEHNEKIEHIYRLIDSIDSLLRAMCQFIPQLTSHSIQKEPKYSLDGDPGIAAAVVAVTGKSPKSPVTKKKAKR